MYVHRLTLNKKADTLPRARAQARTEIHTNIMRQVIFVIIAFAFACSHSSNELAHPYSLAILFAARLQKVWMYIMKIHSCRSLAPLYTPAFAFKGGFWVYAISTVLAHISSVCVVMWDIGVCERTGYDLNFFGDWVWW